MSGTIYMVQDNPEYDGTNAAHPAWWRGHYQGFNAVMDIIEKALNGEKPAGVIGDPRHQEIKDRIWEMIEQSDWTKKEVNR